MNKTYKEIELNDIWRVERAVGFLKKYAKNNGLSCGMYKGHMLYSDTVSVEDAYIEIYGKTQEEYLEEAMKNGTIARHSIFIDGYDQYR